MIYTNNPNKPELLDIPDSEKQFTVFYNRAPNLAVTGAAPVTGYDMSNLISEIYSEYVLWTGDNIVLSCTYTAGVVPDTLILGNPFSNTLSINGEPAIDLTRGYAPGYNQLDPTDQNIVVIPLPPTVTSPLSLTLSGNLQSGKTRLSKIWVGKKTRWPKGSGLSYPLEIRSTGGLTDVGTLYGTTLPARRGLTYSWDIVDDAQRRDMEAYINTVQNSKAHFIMPAANEREFAPPMFVRLNISEFSNNKWLGGWFWEAPSLSWDVLN
jgi:hypothetical protein